MGDTRGREFYIKDLKCIINECIEKRQTNKVQGAYIEGIAETLFMTDSIEKKDYVEISRMIKDNFNFTAEDRELLIK